jgi:hypothetical protein
MLSSDASRRRSLFDELMALLLALLLHAFRSLNVTTMLLAHRSRIRVQRKRSASS